MGKSGLSEYTAESAETMRTALATAKAVLDKENATDSEIQAAIIQMTQAINAMEYGTNKVHLEAIIEVAEKTLANPGDYADVSALEAAVKAEKKFWQKQMQLRKKQMQQQMRSQTACRH